MSAVLSNITLPASGPGVSREEVSFSPPPLSSAVEELDTGNERVQLER